jgi:hypothetical protein
VRHPRATTGGPRLLNPAVRRPMSEDSSLPPMDPVRDVPIQVDSSRPPRAIQLAIKLCWRSVGLRVLYVSLLLSGVIKSGWSGSMLIATMFGSALMLSLTIWLILKISARRNWARMTLAVIVLLSIPYFSKTLPVSFETSLGGGVLFLLVYGTKYLATALLFVRQSSSWFRHAAQPSR